MSARGVHFALTDVETRKLKSLDSDEERLELVQEEIEETFFDSRREDLAETDKAWDAIHRCLTDGTLAGSSGQPLELVVLGGEPLYFGDDYLMTLKTPAQVRALAPLLAEVTRERLRGAYDEIDPRDYDGELGDDDFEYTWDNFVELRAFWARAAEQGRSVLFTADQ